MVWLARLSRKERFLVFVEEWVHSMARWMSHQSDCMSVLSSEYLAIFFLSAFLSVLSRRRCICAHRNIFPLSSIFSLFSLYSMLYDAHRRTYSSRWDASTMKRVRLDVDARYGLVSRAASRSVFLITRTCHEVLVSKFEAILPRFRVKPGKPGVDSARMTFTNGVLRSRYDIRRENELRGNVRELWNINEEDETKIDERNNKNTFK